MRKRQKPNLFVTITFFVRVMARKLNPRVDTRTIRTLNKPKKILLWLYKIQGSQKKR